jgi:hypothetical protein
LEFLGPELTAIFLEWSSSCNSGGGAKNIHARRLPFCVARARYRGCQVDHAGVDGTANQGHAGSLLPRFQELSLHAGLPA